MGKTRAFDADPKRWRMVAAMALDGSTLLEILSPLFSTALVLPVASVANIGKNIGFLTASASRASLHQSLAITGNLGDVTAKSGSQAILASLIGTSIGIGMSSVLAHDTYNFALGFCLLAGIHQGCNYLALQAVPLTYFNRHRLHLLLTNYLASGDVWTPAEVAQHESYIPLFSRDETASWLVVGGSLESACPNPKELEQFLLSSSQASYVARVSEMDDKIHLLFFRDASGQDMIRGMFHACLLQELQDPLKATAQVEEEFPDLLVKMQDKGWIISTDTTSIETSDAKRIELKDDR